MAKSVQSRSRHYREHSWIRSDSPTNALLLEVHFSGPNQGGNPLGKIRTWLLPKYTHSTPELLPAFGEEKFFLHNNLLCSAPTQLQQPLVKHLKPRSIYSAWKCRGLWFQVLPVIYNTRIMIVIPSSLCIILFISSTPCHFLISGRNTNSHPMCTDYLISTSAHGNISISALIHQHTPRTLLESFLSLLLNWVSFLFAFPHQFLFLCGTKGVYLIISTCFF